MLKYGRNSSSIAGISFGSKNSWAKVQIFVSVLILRFEL